jgi:hypothetical protein
MSSQQPTLTQRVFSAAAWNTLLFPARFVAGVVVATTALGLVTLTVLLGMLRG